MPVARSAAVAATLSPAHVAAAAAGQIQAVWEPLGAPQNLAISMLALVREMAQLGRDICLDCWDTALDCGEMGLEGISHALRDRRGLGQALQTAVGFVQAVTGIFIDLCLDVLDIAVALGESGWRAVGRWLDIRPVAAAPVRAQRSKNVRAGDPWHLGVPRIARAGCRTIADVGLDLLDIAVELGEAGFGAIGRMYQGRSRALAAPAAKELGELGAAIALVRTASTNAVNAGLDALDRAMVRGQSVLHAGGQALPGLKKPLVSANSLSTAALAAGLVLALYAVALQLELVSEVRVPAPVALQSRNAPTGARSLTVAEQPAFDADEESSAGDEELAAAEQARALNTGLAGSTQVRPQVPPVDPAQASPPGLASRLSIPAISLDASVMYGTTVLDEATGSLEWQTLPFVAVHYADDTAMIGARGNAVLAGHVVTMREGNVFRELYRVLPGDRVFVEVQGGGTMAYQVTRVQLKSPDAVEVMRSSGEPELTLITCAGAFDQRTRTFSQRLVVVAKLIGTAIA